MGMVGTSQEKPAVDVCAIQIVTLRTTQPRQSLTLVDILQNFARSFFCCCGFKLLSCLGLRYAGSVLDLNVLV